MGGVQKTMAKQDSPLLNMYQNCNDKFHNTGRKQLTEKFESPNSTNKHKTTVKKPTNTFKQHQIFRISMVLARDAYWIRALK